MPPCNGALYPHLWNVSRWGGSGAWRGWRMGRVRLGSGLVSACVFCRARLLIGRVWTGQARPLLRCASRGCADEDHMHSSRCALILCGLVWIVVGQWVGLYTGALGALLCWTAASVLVNGTTHVQGCDASSDIAAAVERMLDGTDGERAHFEDNERSDNRTCAVIGASGFIGQHLVRRLLDEGYYRRILAIDCRSPPYIHDRVIAMAIDMGNATAMEEVLKCNVHCVFLLASIVDTRNGKVHRARLRSVNINGCCNVVRACRNSQNVKRLVFTGSSAGMVSRSCSAEASKRSERMMRQDHTADDDIVLDDEFFRSCGVDAGITTRSDEGEPRVALHKKAAVDENSNVSWYGHTKRVTEFAVRSAACRSLRTLVLRPHVVYGEGDSYTTEKMVLGQLQPPCLDFGRVLVCYAPNLAHYHICADAALRRSDAHSGSAFIVGDEVLPMPQVHKLFSSCRSAPLRSGEAGHPSALVIRSLRFLAHVMGFVDMVTHGYFSWSALQLNPGTLGYLGDFPFCAKRSKRELECQPVYTVEESFDRIRRYYSVGASQRPSIVTPQSDRLPASAAFTPFLSGPLKLRNRIIKAATFEAMCDADGIPLPSLTAFHCDVAKGGAAMTTVAYASVSADGRSFSSQLLVGDHSRSALKDLVKSVHKEGCAVSIQLTHAGYFADRGTIGRKQIAPSCVFNPAGFDWPRAMTTEDIDRVVRDFADAARIVKDVGFDAIELHCGHGYLLSQFLSPYTNRRTDQYGGSIKRRAEVPLRVLRAIKSVVRDEACVFVKMNLSDGFDGGATLDDAVEYARLFLEHGADYLIPSGGFVTRTGLFMLRGKVPLWQMTLNQPTLLKKAALAVFGPFFVPELPYSEAFFAAETNYLLARLGKQGTGRICLVGGISEAHTMECAVRWGYPLMQCGRAILNRPSIIKEMAEGSATRSPCNQCNLCIVGSTMKQTPLECAAKDIEDCVRE